MTVSIEESVTTAQGNVSAVIHMRYIFLNVLVHKLYIQETRNGVVLTLGSYGERCALILLDGMANDANPRIERYPSVTTPHLEPVLLELT